MEGLRQLHGRRRMGFRGLGKGERVAAGGLGLQAQPYGLQREA